MVTVGGKAVVAPCRTLTITHRPSTVKDDAYNTDQASHTKWIVSDLHVALLMSLSSPRSQTLDSNELQVVSPLTSDGELASDDDISINHQRSSAEIEKHDHGILAEEEEREKLLTGGDPQDAPRDFFKSSSHINKKIHRPRRRRRKGITRSHDEEGKLMYEMEEGGPRSDTSSQASSSSAELDKLNPARPPMSKVSRVSLYGRTQVPSDVPSSGVR